MDPQPRTWFHVRCDRAFTSKHASPRAQTVPRSRVLDKRRPLPKTNLQTPYPNLHSSNDTRARTPPNPTAHPHAATAHVGTETFSNKVKARPAPRHVGPGGAHNQISPPARPIPAHRRPGSSTHRPPPLPPPINTHLELAQLPARQVASIGPIRIQIQPLPPSQLRARLD
jgi:hypothetical protein